jgi:hypothetical protein
MGIEDIQISEELETNAPSIKYRGDEGPRSPQEEQQMMMAQLEEAYGQYVDEMIEMGQEDSIMPLRQFIEQAMAEGQMASGNPLPQDPTKPVNPFQPKPTGPVLPNRQMAAYGGIMGIDGRRQYGLGSFLKKTVRKIIPNEVADIAVKAAPFVAPFNPIAAGLMAGVGGFDQTGKIGSSIKSGLMNYGLGQGARYLGGAGFQTGINPMTGSGVQGAGFFSKPTGTETGLGKFFSRSKAPTDMTEFNKLGLGGSDPSGIAGNTSNISLAGDSGTAMEAFYKGGMEPSKIVAEQAKAFKIADLPGLVKKNLQAAGLGNNLMTGLLVGGLGAGALMGNMTEAEVQDMSRGEGLDVEAIRTEVLTAMKDPTGEALKAIRIKYPFLGTRRSKNIDAIGKAMGGRIRRAEGGLMDLGGMEKDYRAEGGFVPIGKAEKADDVPARLSVNEFVFTADAVRNAGGGDIDRGAEVMENMMKHLEQGGQVSDESQGMAGAQQMFETSERLSEVI